MLEQFLKIGLPILTAISALYAIVMTVLAIVRKVKLAVVNGKLKKTEKRTKAQLAAELAMKDAVKKVMLEFANEKK